MIGLILTQHGAEQLTQNEVLKLAPKVGCEQRRGCVVVTTGDINDLYTITYMAQSIWKVLLLLVDANSVDGAKDKLKSSSIKEHITQGTSFSCRSFIDGGYESSQELQAEIGGLAKEITQANVDLKNPDVQLFVIEQSDRCYIGIDLAGIDLAKREYRVFSSFEHLKASTAFAALLFAGYDAKKTLVDPFCKSGMVPIEAALHATKLSPHFYTKDRLACYKDAKEHFEKLDKAQDFPKLPITASDAQSRHISAAKKNAKIAGVHKTLTFSRQDLDWLEVRLGENSTDLIVAHPPHVSRTFSEKKANKVYAELFYQAQYILKKAGSVTLIAKDPALLLKAAEEKGFKEQDRLQVAQGQEVLWLLKLNQPG